MSEQALDLWCEYACLWALSCVTDRSSPLSAIHQTPHLCFSLRRVPGLFPEGVSQPRAPALCPRHVCRPRADQQSGDHHPLRPWSLHCGTGSGCTLRGHVHPQGGGVRSVRRRAGLQRQITGPLLMDSKSKTRGVPVWTDSFSPERLSSFVSADFRLWQHVSVHRWQRWDQSQLDEVALVYLS